jgi:hypothetical protein
MNSTKITFFALVILTSLTPEISSAPNFPDTLSEIIRSEGFFEVANQQFLKTDYNDLYKKFDTFIDLMSQNPDFAGMMYFSEKSFLSSPKQKSRYCSAPPSFRNPREHPTKRFNKIYFQFILEHYALIKQEHAEYLTTNPDAQKFLGAMLSVDQIAKDIFSAAIEAIDKKCPGFKQTMYGKHGELTVITKVVRYEKIDGWGTTPHFDKSALSLVWDSNDDNDDSLLICENRLHPSLEALVKPIRGYSHKKDTTSAILIAGSAFSKVGIDIKPTLHAVAPIQKQYRHAIISFLLIPDIDMSDLKTDFI